MICHINCSDLTQATDLHLKLAYFLDFPEWYGNNLDALYDCLSELPTPTQLHFSGWSPTKPWSTGFQCVLTDAQQSNLFLNVFFE